MKQLFLLLFLLFPLLTPFANAQEATVSAEEQTSYTLPYPGLLPDNPLYPLKVLRDKFVFFLISDPLKKAEFSLLKADKSMSSGNYLLLRRNKDEALAYATFSKGQEALANAIKYSREAKRQGAQTDELNKKMVTAAGKHEEVFIDVLEKATPHFKEKFQVLFEKSTSFKKEARKMAPK